MSYRSVQLQRVLSKLGRTSMTPKQSGYFKEWLGLFYSLPAINRSLSKFCEIWPLRGRGFTIDGDPDSAAHFGLLGAREIIKATQNDFILDYREKWQASRLLPFGRTADASHVVLDLDFTIGHPIGIVSFDEWSTGPSNLPRDCYTLWDMNIVQFLELVLSDPCNPVFSLAGPYGR